MTARQQAEYEQLFAKHGDVRGVITHLLGENDRLRVLLGAQFATDPSLTKTGIELPDVPELKGTVPLVLYFGNVADADEFIEIFRQAKPGMVMHKL